MSSTERNTNRRKGKTNLKEIVAISGKGGTGKTSVAASFAALARDVIIADCDVDAANLYLLLRPEVREQRDFSGGKKASVIRDRCVGCGKCGEVCSFGAAVLEGPGNDVVASTYTIDPVACEGCGVCAWFCPAEAIRFEDAINGQWFISKTRFGPMVHAQLGVAQENSGKLVSLVRKQARRIAEELSQDLVIVDGPPGVGCPVIASVTGADLVLAVAEPTVSARHDLARVIDLAEHFQIPAAVCVNKYDINVGLTEDIEAMAKQRRLPVLGKIAYDNVVTEAQVRGQTIVEHSRNGVAQQVVQLWQRTLEMLRRA